MVGTGTVVNMSISVRPEARSDDASDRGEGGKYLILPPGYDGPLPEGGFSIVQAKTTRVALLGRAFMENNDPKPAVETIRKFTKVYPYEAGGVGTSVAEFLTGKYKLAKITPPPPAVFHEGSGKVMNTIPRTTSASTRSSTICCSRSRPPRSTPN
jgi:hypothetical protein